MSSDKAKWIAHKSTVAAPYWDRHVAWAVRAVQLGKATADQQKLAWDWIMYVTHATPEYSDLSFRLGPDAERETAFAEGKRFVGMQLLKMTSPALDGAIEKEMADEVKAEKARAREEKRNKDA